VVPVDRIVVPHLALPDRLRSVMSNCGFGGVEREDAWRGAGGDNLRRPREWWRRWLTVRVGMGDDNDRCDDR
jgi:hypothetical protein